MKYLLEFDGCKIDVVKEDNIMIACSVSLEHDVPKGFKETTYTKDLSRTGNGWEYEWFSGMIFARGTLFDNGPAPMIDDPEDYFGDEIPDPTWVRKQEREMKIGRIGMWSGSLHMQYDEADVWVPDSDEDNGTYISDKPEIRFGDIIPEECAELSKEVMDIAMMTWNPKLPKTMDEVRDIQIHLNIFHRMNGWRIESYNRILKRLNKKEIESFPIKGRHTESELKSSLDYLGKKILTMYMVRVNMNMDVRKWLWSMWDDSSIIESEVEFVPLMDGFSSETADYLINSPTETNERTVLNDKEVWLINYFAYSLLRTGYAKSREILDSVINVSDDVYLPLLELVDYVHDIGFRHPATERWIKAQKTTAKSLEPLFIEHVHVYKQEDYELESRKILMFEV